MLVDLLHAVSFGFLGLVTVAVGGYLTTLQLRTVREIVALVREAERSFGWPSTRAVVTRSVVTREQGEKWVKYDAALRYEYRVDGKTYSSTRYGFDEDFAKDRGLEHASVSAAARPKGGPLEVYYDPQRPECAVVDRTPPRVLSNLVLIAVLLVPSFGMVIAGALMVQMALREPATVAAGEEMGQFGVAAFVTLAAFGFVVAVIRRFREGAVRRFLRLVRSAKPVLAGAAEPGTRVLVSGQIEAVPGQTASLPFGPDATVYQRLTVFGGEKRLLRRTAHTAFWLRDTSGAVLVQPEGGEGLCQKRPVPETPELEDFLDSLLPDDRGVVTASMRLELEALCPDDAAVVIGEVHRDPQTDAFVFRAIPDVPESLLFSDGSRDELVARLSKGPKLTNGIALLALLSCVVAGFWYSAL